MSQGKITFTIVPPTTPRHVFKRVVSITGPGKVYVLGGTPTFTNEFPRREACTPLVAPFYRVPLKSTRRLKRVKHEPPPSPEPRYRKRRRVAVPIPESPTKSLSSSGHNLIL